MHIAPLFRLVVVGTLACAIDAGAQGTASKPDEIPAAMMPPPGLCRIWLAGVPANKQPAPSDCATAVRNKPTSGRVVFGPPLAASAARALEAPSRSVESGAKRGDAAPAKTSDKSDAKGSDKSDPRGSAKGDSVVRRGGGQADSTASKARGRGRGGNRVM